MCIGKKVKFILTCLSYTFCLHFPQLVAEALHANSHVVQQLQLQHMALLTNRFSVSEADFPGGKDVYVAYRCVYRGVLAHAQVAPKSLYVHECMRMPLTYCVHMICVHDVGMAKGWVIWKKQGHLVAPRCSSPIHVATTLV